MQLSFHHISPPKPCMHLLSSIYILYYALLYYIMLYYIILHYIMLYYITLHYIILLYYIILYYIILYCYIILCYIILHYIILHYIILYVYTHIYVGFNGSEYLHCGPELRHRAAWYVDINLLIHLHKTLLCHNHTFYSPPTINTNTTVIRVQTTYYSF
jgi:hypothetical protein